MNVENSVQVGTWGRQHDLHYKNNYATKGTFYSTNVPNSSFEPLKKYTDAVWPVEGYNICVGSGLEPAYQKLIPANVIPLQDMAFPASVTAAAGSSLTIKSVGDAATSVWFAPSGTTAFVEGPTMTKAAGTSTTIKVPATKGSYRLYVVGSNGASSTASAAALVAN